ncbi:hypothetical protein Y1Q_0010605 [Alligator mississippiensis]|uniref:Uncharacterized protein n=1 Tax=Alligator mississippiensis TaxID=8496 RepID=A0A151PGJ8_ALLMI|nr:hypothetical protein Y1Q_0010605 [Alligator mississippiensis]
MCRAPSGAEEETVPLYPDTRNWRPRSGNCRYQNTLSFVLIEEWAQGRDRAVAISQEEGVKNVPCILLIIPKLLMVKHVELMATLEELDIDAKDLRILRSPFWDQTAGVKIENVLSDFIQIKTSLSVCHPPGAAASLPALLQGVSFPSVLEPRLLPGRGRVGIREPSRCFRSSRCWPVLPFSLSLLVTALQQRPVLPCPDGRGKELSCRGPTPAPAGWSALRRPELQGPLALQEIPPTVPEH